MLLVAFNRTLTQTGDHHGKELLIRQLLSMSCGAYHYIRVDVCSGRLYILCPPCFCFLFLPSHLTLSSVSLAPKLRPDDRCQAFTTPYASTMLDRLQTCAYGSQFLILFIGMLFATDRGEEGTNTHDMLKLVFYLVFWTMGSIAGFMGLRDLWCVRRLTRP